MASVPVAPETKRGGDEPSVDSGSMGSEVLEKNRARLAKLERIKRKLKDRDSRLSVLVRENNSSILSGDVKPYETRNSAGEADSKEAVRVLSYAAFKLQRQVDKKTDEATALRRTVGELEEALQAKEKEKSTLTVDMSIFRRSLQAYSDHIDRLSLELETKNKAMEGLINENDRHKREAEELKDRLAAARKDYEWIRTESMSKREQVEYFEYELLSKNGTIDELHDEIDKKLKRIVELEVDMELMDARSSRSLEKKSGNDAIPNLTKSVSFEEADEVNTSRKSLGAPRRNALFRIRELKCQSKAHDFEAADRMLMGIASGDASLNGSFPTDMSTDTTAVMTGSTDGSCPPGRVHRTTGKRNGRGTKPPPHHHQYIEAIDNLRSDLQAIEAKYKEDKYYSTKLIEKLKQENNEYLIKLVCMESKTKKKDNHGASLSLLLEDLNDGMDRSHSSMFEGSVVSGDTPVDPNTKMRHAKSTITNGKLPNKDEFYQKKIESLEGERGVLQQTVQELESKIKSLEKIGKHRAKADKRRIDYYVFQNKAQATQIAEIRDRASSSSSYNEDQETAPDYAATLEDKIQQQSKEIEGLQLENELKDRTIETLRSQLIAQRTNQQRFADV